MMKQTNILIVLAAISFLAVGLIGNASATHGDPAQGQNHHSELTSSSDNGGIGASMGGFSSYGAERITFEGFLERPVFLMTSSHVHIVNGKVVDQFANIFIDGELIDPKDVGYTIDMGREPSGEIHESWLGVQGYYEIPYHIFNLITEDGKHIALGRGNSNVDYDANGEIIFLDSDDDPIN